jgi:hypothetical protein
LIKKKLTPAGSRPEDLSFGAVLFAGGKWNDIVFLKEKE